MPDDAQYEIQTLTELKDKASSKENMKGSGRSWRSGRDREGRLVLRKGVVTAEKEGVDRKHKDPWNLKPKQQLALPRVVNPVPAVPTVAVTVQAQACVQVQARRGLRYVENKTSEEVKKKIEEIVSDLFLYKKD
jgi:hypothetical protein